MSSLSGFDELLVEFGQTLRHAGISIGSDDILTFCSGVSQLDVSDLMDVYWAGRATMVRRQDQVPIYNAVFKLFFLDIDESNADPRKLTLKSSSTAGATIEIPNTEEGIPGDISPDEVKLGYLASTSDVYRLKAFSECSDEEVRQLRKLISRMRVTPPVRRTHRTTRSRKAARLDLRRMVRESMRKLGEPRDLAYKKRKEKLRPLVLILDVSGSMADYSRNLLQFAYSARRANAKVDVFCFGNPASPASHDLWIDVTQMKPCALQVNLCSIGNGGTRIGDSIKAFTKDARRSRLGRGAVVVICSDGLDRGEPAALSQAMESLSRIAHRVIWVNPHKGDVVDYVPASLGMIVAEPFIDEVYSGHNLASLERLANRLSKVG